jgi:TldD protein
MKVAPTGNGRRESYAHIPMPRMTNTFMLAGESAPEDILRSVKKGLYAVSFGGGRSTSPTASSSSPRARPT